MIYLSGKCLNFGLAAQCAHSALCNIIHPEMHVAHQLIAPHSFLAAEATVDALASQRDPLFNGEIGREQRCCHLLHWQSLNVHYQVLRRQSAALCCNNASVVQGYACIQITCTTRFLPSCVLPSFREQAHSPWPHSPASAQRFDGVAASQNHPTSDPASQQRIHPRRSSRCC